MSAVNRNRQSANWKPSPISLGSPRTIFWDVTANNRGMYHGQQGITVDESCCPYVSNLRRGQPGLQHQGGGRRYDPSQAPLPFLRGQVQHCGELRVHGAGQKPIPIQSIESRAGEQRPHNDHTTTKLPKFKHNESPLSTVPQWITGFRFWLRGQDLNLQPSGCELRSAVQFEAFRHVRAYSQQSALEGVARNGCMAIHQSFIS